MSEVVNAGRPAAHSGEQLEVLAPFFEKIDYG